MLVDGRALRSHVAEKDTMGYRSKGLISRSVSKAQRGCCVLQVGVNVTPQVWLKRYWSDTYITKNTHSFLEPNLNNSAVKCACCGEILGWVTSWKVSQTVCEEGWSTLKKLVMIYKVSQQSLKLFLVTIRDLIKNQGIKLIETLVV